jgi:D-3-phosphoglycerate dehydrogenase
MRALVLAPFSDEGLARLRARGAVDYESWLDTGRLWEPEALGARLAADGVDVLLVEADFVFAETLEAAPMLRLVGVCRNALNHVDLDVASERGVAVVHAPGRNTTAVAEMALGLMLALARRLPQAHTLVAGGGWSDPAAGYRMLRGREIAGSTVGIVGLGRIGREVARMAHAMGADVLAHDQIVSASQMAAAGCRAVSLTELAAAADFVTLHVPEDDGTRGMVGAAFFGTMKRGAYLVNTSGGGVVDSEALAEALRSGHIAGAALDVFEGQPLPISSPLLAAPNVLLTPHIGGATVETVERHSRMMAEEVERLLDGRPLQHVVNPS